MEGLGRGPPVSLNPAMTVLHVERTFIGLIYKYTCEFVAVYKYSKFVHFSFNFSNSNHKRSTAETGNKTANIL